ncbi:T-cell surface glycoprotein CD3 epsilon chain [Dasypus novemcinctus]|uniref:T-cell surface glycoprotein CD3 epsilon chain n=1 Tax=Dasypus novemcinctus TaxID=9361 RepID=UPI00019554DE|nr:T-cell surface glycoprotein CD3 epsilon chain [Dasypus novemcinctus]
MQSRTLWIALGLCLFSVGAWGEDNEETGAVTQKRFKVDISGTTVVLTCPEESSDEDITWERNDAELPPNLKKGHNQLELRNFSEVDNSGLFTCYPGKSKSTFYLYLKARVCENCMEVNLMGVVAVVIVDVCITLGLLLVVYYWSKSRKAKAKPVARGVGAGNRPRGQNRERPPPVPNPDYEPIRKGQRDLYAGLNQRGV